MTIAAEIKNCLQNIKTKIWCVVVKTKYPGHKIVIRDQVFDIGNNINIVEDLSAIIITGSLDLPNVTFESWSTAGLRKYDAISIYFKYFDSDIDRQNSTVNDMDLILTGYIDTLPISEDKSIGLNYNGLTFKSTLGLAWERTSQIPFTTLPVKDIINTALKQTDLRAFVTDIVYDSGIPDYLNPKIDSTYYFGNVLEQIRDKYAIQIYQTGKGVLYIRRPSYFYNAELTVYEYDIQENIFNIDYGDITQKVDSVCVLGSNCAGIAFDPIAYQLRLGETPDGTTVVPEGDKLNPLFLNRRDFYNQEDCQKFAREKLVELAKNYAISFDTIYQTDQNIGDMFIIKNSSVIDENQKWIIKSRTVTISKDSIICNVVGYSNSIQDLPENILLSAIGVLDTDILELSNRDVIATVLR